MTVIKICPHYRAKADIGMALQLCTCTSCHHCMDCTIDGHTAAEANIARDGGMTAWLAS